MRLLPSNLRWELIMWLDRRLDTCWADLVLWALYGHKSFWELLPRTSTFGNGVGRCKRDALRDGTCYCAKFATATEAQEHGLSSHIVAPEDEPQFERGLTIRFK